MEYVFVFPFHSCFHYDERVSDIPFNSLKSYNSAFLNCNSFMLKACEWLLRRHNFRMIAQIQIFARKPVINTTLAELPLLCLSFTTFQRHNGICSLEHHNISYILFPFFAGHVQCRETASRLSVSLAWTHPIISTSHEILQMNLSSVKQSE